MKWEWVGEMGAEPWEREEARGLGLTWTHRAHRAPGQAGIFNLGRHKLFGVFKC